jgi:peptide/nickel transport system substrate-binding protein
VAVSVAVLTAACGGGSGSTSGTNASAPAGGTLTIGFNTAPYSSFDPWAAGQGPNQDAMYADTLLYDSLTKLNSAGQPIPSLATSWQSSGNSLTLNLRKGVTFSDGTAVNANAVKANLDYGAANPAGNQCDIYLGGIKTTVTSPYTVQLALPHPVPGLLQDLAQCAGFIVNPKALNNPNSLNSQGNGSGPYTIDTAASLPGHSWVFVRKASYWDAKDWPYAKIVQTYYPTQTALDNAGSAGQIDLSAQIFDTKDTASGLTFLAGAPDDFPGFYITDITGAVAKPLGNTSVRQAMNYALNRPAIASAVFGAKYAVVSHSTPFPPQYLGYSTSLAQFYPYNPSKAKQLLQAAGYPQGFTVNALCDPQDETYCEAISGEERAVGINLNVSVHGSDFITQMQSGKWPLVLGHYTLNVGEYQTIYGIAGPSGFWNPRHNTSPAVSSLLGKIAAAPSNTAAAPLYGELATTLAQQAWYLNPVFLPTVIGYNAKAISVSVIEGLPVPMLYDVKPKG